MVEGFVGDVVAAMGEFFRAPFVDLSLLWQLIPVLLIWILMEWYFGMYKNEKLGWNSAVGNGVSLFWIGVTSMQHVFSNRILMTTERIIILGLIISYSLFIIYVSFKHKIRAKIDFFLASPTPIYFASFVVLLYAHDTISFTVAMFVAIIVILGLLLIVDKVIRTLIPEASNDEPEGGSDILPSADMPPTDFVANEPGMQAGVDQFNQPTPDLNQQSDPLGAKF